MTPFRTLLAACLFLPLLAGEASATSGFGCYRVNVGPNDPLNIRARPSARSPVVASYHWGNQPIIALSGGLARGEAVQPSLFDVHMAEFQVCQPADLPLGARWCPVTIFDGAGSRSGWLKRRFVDHSECP
jgi:hypothetical protein